MLYVLIFSCLVLFIRINLFFTVFRKEFISFLYIFERIILNIYKMKKLIALFLGITVLSCSSEDQLNNEVVSTADTSASVLDGKMLSFKNEESFVKEYSELSLLSNEDIKKWVSSKKLISLQSISENISDMEGDELSETRVIYSEALKSILNFDSKVKIDGKALWLNERTFYLLSVDEINKSSEQLIAEKDKLEVYGSLLSVSKPDQNLTARNVLPNENRIKTFVTDEGSFNVPGSRIRHVLDLYNETIVLNDEIQSSKMFLRSTLQYRSCSTWRCTWKEASNIRSIDTYSLTGSNSVLWKFSLLQTATSTTSTFLLATWNPSNLPAPANPSQWFTNFNVSGPFKIYVGNGPWLEIPISWY